MKYIVGYYVEDEGVYLDTHSRLFDTRKSAREYACKLNQELAEFSECEIEDLGDYYDVRPIEELKNDR